MIQVNEYDINPPPETIKTEEIEKPAPDRDPVPIYESTSLLDTSSFGHGKDRAVLFSGGDDSLALTHMAFENDWADIAIHLDTNSSIPGNIDYVRRVCEKYSWPLIILTAPMSLSTFGFRYGFPGSGSHTMAFNYFKGRQLGTFENHREGTVKYISGVRKLESNRRMKNVDAEVEYEDSSNGGNFDGWWISPLIDKSDEWVHEYRENHDLPRNPIAKKIHRSGDCQCFAFGNRGTELTQIEAEYPDFGEWLLNVESRVQEYRGRVAHLEEEYPAVYGEVSELRKETEPNPLRLTIVKKEYPDVFADIVSLERETAISKGQTDPTNYIGHGGMSSSDLRSLVSQADECQQTLCENCVEPSDGLVPSVQRQKKRAADRLENETIQTELSKTYP